jgi:hypothetical protein
MSIEKTLATFRVEKDRWEAFKNKAQRSGNNASEVLNKFIDDYIDGPHLDTNIDRHLDKHTDTVISIDTDKQLDARLDNLIEARLGNRLDVLDNLDSNIDKRIEAAIARQMESSLGEYAA